MSKKNIFGLITNTNKQSIEKIFRSIGYKEFTNKDIEHRLNILDKYFDNNTKKRILNNQNYQVITNIESNNVYNYIKNTNGYILKIDTLDIINKNYDKYIPDITIKNYYGDKKFIEQIKIVVDEYKL